MKNRKRDSRDAAVLITAAVLLVLTAVTAGRRPVRLDFDEHLDQTVLTVDGRAYMLRDLAFYIAYEEQLIEDQARLYSPEDTNSYWNLHINGEFIRESARKAAMDMAVHDLIFCQLAEDGGLALSEEDSRRMEMGRTDFWNDLSECQQLRLEGLRGDIDTAMERMALAQQQQGMTAACEGRSYEDYSLNSPEYEQIRQLHAYEIQTDLWERLDFGNITLSH